MLIYRATLFQSKSEIACAKLLEKHVQGWSAETGKTYAVQLGFGRSIDFRVGDALIEYHPISLMREFKNRKSYAILVEQLRRINPQVRAVVLKTLEHEFLAQYVEKRKWLLQHSTDDSLRRCELIVCDGPKSFYIRALKRFGRNVPSLREVLRLFRGSS